MHRWVNSIFIVLVFFGSLHFSCFISDSKQDQIDVLKENDSKIVSTIRDFANATSRVIKYVDVVNQRVDNLPANKLPRLAKKLSPSVVKITVDAGYDYYTGEQMKWAGSGVFVSKDLILTAGHVVDTRIVEQYADPEYLEKGGIQMSVELADGTILEVLEVVVDCYMEDPRIPDLGLVKVKLPEVYTLNNKLVNPKPLPFGVAEVGETVFAIGGPFRLFPTVTSGIISAINTDVPENFFGKINLIQTDTPLNPGNSGCPIFNMNGEIVSICVGRITNSDGIGFTVPAEVCRMVIEKYLATGALEEVE